MIFTVHSSENGLPLNPLAYYHVSFFKWLFEGYFPFSDRPISDICWTRLLRVEMSTEQTWRAAAQRMCFQRCAALKKTTVVRYQNDFAGNSWYMLVNVVGISSWLLVLAKMPDVVATCCERNPLEIKGDNGNPACLPAWALLHWCLGCDKHMCLTISYACIIFFNGNQIIYIFLKCYRISIFPLVHHVRWGFKYDFPI